MADAAARIRAGGIVAFPTRGIYGLAADPFNRTAVARLFEIKKRRPEKPILVLVRDEADILRLAAAVPPAARSLMTRLWPGGITLVLPARRDIPPELTAGTGTIGLRLPSHPVAAALAAAVGGPVTATSANFSGEPGCSRACRICRPR